MVKNINQSNCKKQTHLNLFRTSENLKRTCLPTHFLHCLGSNWKRRIIKLNIYTQYLLKLYDFFFHRPVGLVELLILYAHVQFYMHRASDYRLISKTGLEKYWKPCSCCKGIKINSWRTYKSISQENRSLLS